MCSAALWDDAGLLVITADMKCAHIPMRFIFFSLLHLVVFLDVVLMDSLQVMWLAMDTKQYHISPNMQVSFNCAKSYDFWL